MKEKLNNINSYSQTRRGNPTGEERKEMKTTISKLLNPIIYLWTLLIFTIYDFSKIIFSDNEAGEKAENVKNILLPEGEAGEEAGEKEQNPDKDKQEDDKSIEPPEPVTVEQLKTSDYRVGSKTYTYEELVKEASDRFKTDISKLSPEIQADFLQTIINAKYGDHRKEWMKAASERDKILSSKKRQLDSQIETYKKKIDELEKVLDEEFDPDDFTEAELRKKDRDLIKAELQLPDLKKTVKAAEAEKQKLFYTQQVNLLSAKFPELDLGESFEQIVSKYKDKKSNVKYKKAALIVDIIADAIENGIDPVDYYTTYDFKYQQGLHILHEAERKQNGAQLSEKEVENLKKKAIQFADKQKDYKPKAKESHIPAPKQGTMNDNREQMLSRIRA